MFLSFLVSREELVVDGAHGAIQVGALDDEVAGHGRSAGGGHFHVVLFPGHAGRV
jgi:hypothetical protein